DGIRDFHVTGVQTCALPICELSTTIQNPKMIKELMDRLKRIEGQARGIQRMLEEGRPCEDIVTQLSAMRNAVEKVATHVILENRSEERRVGKGCRSRWSR